MAFNAFLGKSQAWLEEQLAIAQSDYSAGAVTTSAGSGDVTVGKEIRVSPKTRILELYAALRAIDPVRYPASATSLTRRTTALFRDSVL